MEFCCFQGLQQLANKLNLCHLASFFLSLQLGLEGNTSDLIAT